MKTIETPKLHSIATIIKKSQWFKVAHWSDGSVTVTFQIKAGDEAEQFEMTKSEWVNFRRMYPEIVLSD